MYFDDLEEERIAKARCELPGTYVIDDWDISITDGIKNQYDVRVIDVIITKIKESKLEGLLVIVVYGVKIYATCVSKHLVLALRDEAIQMVGLQAIEQVDRSYGNGNKSNDPSQ